MRERLVENWWMLAVRGIAGILFGILALVLPGITLFTLVLLYGAYALVDGAFALGVAVRSRGRPRAGILALQGILGILIGIVTLVWPQITAVVLLAVIAVWAFLTGFVEIAAAIRLRKEMQGEWVLLLSGIASVVFGIILVARPGIGALAVVTIIGIYAIVGGVLMLWVSFKVRSILRAGGLPAVGATG
ncbi:MAG TPA: HdeD family acid-resistance protein [Acidimicrobiales bacterium]|nr:HdeD family acid-resistance protein [Acidimicrobiales bacterium]